MMDWPNGLMEETSYNKSYQLVFRVSATAVAFAASLGITPALSQTKQEHIHEMGQTVMPFDLNKTMHVFRMTNWAGSKVLWSRMRMIRTRLGLSGNISGMRQKPFSAATTPTLRRFTVQRCLACRN